MFQLKAKVLCEYSPRGNPLQREISEVVLVCDGESGEQVIDALARIYPRWQHPIILDIEWQ